MSTEPWPFWYERYTYIHDSYQSIVWNNKYHLFVLLSLSQSCHEALVKSPEADRILWAIIVAVVCCPASVASCNTDIKQKITASHHTPATLTPTALHTLTPTTHPHTPHLTHTHTTYTSHIHTYTHHTCTGTILTERVNQWCEGTQWRAIPVPHSTSQGMPKLLPPPWPRKPRRPSLLSGNYWKPQVYTHTYTPDHTHTPLTILHPTVCTHIYAAVHTPSHRLPDHSS